MHLHSILMLAATGVVAAFVVVVIAVAWLRARGVISSASRTVGFQKWSSTLAAASSLGAGAIHLVVIPEHGAEYLPAGVFFAVLAVFQVAWAGAMLWRSNARIAIAGLAVNAATIGIWLWSRTLGLPLGAEPGAVEPVGYQDALATVLELGLVIVVGLLVWERWRSPIARLKISEADAFVGTGLGISAIAIFTAVAFLVGGH